MTAWRARNETPDDLENEARIIELYAQAFGNKVAPSSKLSEFLYSVDYALYQEPAGTLLAFVEVKCATRDIELHWPLSAAKFRTMVNLAETFQVPAILVLETPSALLEHRILARDIDGRLPYRVKRNGRRRGQNGDIEPCVILEPGDFRTVALPPR